MSDLAVQSPLPHLLPACANQRIALFVIRRMGAHGLADARAVQAMLAAFGAGYRRPLMLMRSLMADLAAASSTSIMIAPCCCPRATACEIGLIAVLELAETNSAKARLLLADLMGSRRIDGVLASATAVASAFADLGRPLRPIGGSLGDAIGGSPNRGKQA